MSEYCPNSREIPFDMTWPWYAVAIQFACDRAKGSFLGYVHSIDVLHSLDFMGRARNKDDTVSCDAFSLAQHQLLLWNTGGGNEHPSQPVTRNTSCFES